MKAQSKYFIRVVVASVCLVTLIPVSKAPAQTGNPASFYMASSAGTEVGVKGPVSDWHYYAEDGYIKIDNPKKNITFRINGRIIADAGYIDAKDELQKAFPGLEGGNMRFRELTVSTYGNFYDSMDFRVGIDFANVRDIQDIWIRYLKHPFLKNIKFGNLKEPFSLEYLTSISRITFMERSLPDEAFTAGHDIGFRYDSSNPDQRIKLGLGFFLNTESFSDLGEAKNQISEANGINTTARVFGLPVFEENGKKLLHLGLGYSLGWRNEHDLHYHVAFRTRPESRLTDARLVNTGNIPGKRRDKFNAEMAGVFGPWSFQGQGYFIAVDTKTADNPGFWGYYTFLSYFVTGEHRKYNRHLGIFTGVVPQPVFHPMKGQWGAWELALRHSYVDLNDGMFKGGKESNITLGLNWMHNRNTRWMFNYTNAYVKDRASPLVKNDRAHIFQVRFQFIW